VAVRKPTWSTSSFVLDVGAFTVLGAAAGALAFFSSRYGDGAFVAWTLLPLAVLYAIAHDFRRCGRWLPAGLFIVVDMVVWIAFLAALERWWGSLPDQLDGPFAGSHGRLWLLLVVVIATAAVHLRQFRFPLLVVFAAALSSFHRLARARAGRARPCWVSPGPRRDGLLRPEVVQRGRPHDALRGRRRLRLAAATRLRRRRLFLVRLGLSARERREQPAA